jgi:hypothetical protein
MAMGEEPAGGRQTVNQYLNPALRQQQLLLASARAIELEPEPPRYHLFDGVCQDALRFCDRRRDGRQFSQSRPEKGSLSTNMSTNMKPRLTPS